jgi:hypothetical protein
VCPELESLILRLLAVNPAKRFKGQARHAAEALEHAAENAAPSGMCCYSMRPPPLVTH